MRLRGIHKRFGGVTAVDGVTFNVAPGEVVGLIGPNGAGKTTLFELIGGFTKPDTGRISFDGHELVRPIISLRGRTFWQRNRSAENRAQLGLIRSFQDAALFPTMSVEEVLMLAMERSYPTPVFSSMVGSDEAERPKRERARDLIATMGLEGVPEQVDPGAIDRDPEDS